MQLDEPLRAVVTLFAERLKRTEPKFIDIAVVWLDVIAVVAGVTMPRSRQYLQSGCSSSWCFLIRAQRAEEYHLSHFVGWPRAPIVLSPI